MWDDSTGLLPAIGVEAPDCSWGLPDPRTPPPPPWNEEPDVGMRFEGEGISPPLAALIIALPPTLPLPPPHDGDIAGPALEL